MPSYLSLVNWTDQGVRNVKDSPQRFEGFKKAVEAAGGRVIFCYLLMGQYDLAILMEVADDATAARLAMATAALGNIRTTTLKAFTEEEYGNIVKSLP